MYFYYFFVLIGLLTVKYADVMELVDVPDSKSGVGNYVPVRPRPSANKNTQIFGYFYLVYRADARFYTRDINI